MLQDHMSITPSETLASLQKAPSYLNRRFTHFKYEYAFALPAEGRFP